MLGQSGDPEVDIGSADFGGWVDFQDSSYGWEFIHNLLNQSKQPIANLRLGLWVEIDYR
jgi:hypothetical protein